MPRPLRDLALMVVLALALASICFRVASAARDRQPERIALPRAACDVGTDYVLIARLAGIDTELGRWPCNDVPACVDRTGLWPDDAILGRSTVGGISYEVPAVRQQGSADPCPP